MTNALCPYCRGAIDPAQEEQVICEGCETPHHRDCYEENGGCTVFGCRCAPADEPRVRVSPPELSHVGRAAPQANPRSTLPSYSVMGVSDRAPATAPASPVISSTDGIGGERHKSKMTFVLLGVLLGAVGAHNFYAGYKKKAITQICITVLTLGYAVPMTWIWAIIDICTVERDSQGIQFKS